MDSKSRSNWRFQALSEYFDDYAACAERCPFGRLVTQPQFGLKPRSYPSDNQHPDLDPTGDNRDWTRFMRHVGHLNSQSSSNVVYKVIFLTRHGVGYHNDKHAQVGDELWEHHWSYLNGDDHTEWFDSFLTDKGIQQAKCISAIWKDAVVKDGVPIHDSIYTSPYNLPNTHLLKS